MTDAHQIILVVDDHMSEEAREMLQSEVRRHGISRVLIIAAGLMAVSSRMSDMIVELGRINARIPEIPPALFCSRSF